MDLEGPTAEHVLQAIREAEQVEVWLPEGGGWNGVGGEAGGVSVEEIFTATAWGGAGTSAEEQHAEGAKKNGCGWNNNKFVFKK